MLFHLDDLVPSPNRIRASNDVQLRLKQLAFLVGGVWTTAASAKAARLDEWFEWSVYRGWVVSNQVTTEPTGDSAPVLRVGAAGLMPHRNCLGLWIFAADGVLVEMAEVGISTRTRWCFRSVNPVAPGEYVENCIERIDDDTIEVSSRVCPVNGRASEDPGQIPEAQVRRLIRHRHPGQ